MQERVTIDYKQYQIHLKHSQAIEALEEGKNIFIVDHYMDEYWKRMRVLTRDQVIVELANHHENAIIQLEKEHKEALDKLKKNNMFKKFGKWTSRNIGMIAVVISIIALLFAIITLLIKKGIL